MVDRGIDAFAVLLAELLGLPLVGMLYFSTHVRTAYADEHARGRRVVRSDGPGTAAGAGCSIPVAQLCHRLHRRGRVARL